MIDDRIERQMLKVGEVAAMLGICSRGIWRLVQRGDLPRPNTVGQRSARWHITVVEAYIERIRKVGSQ